MSRRAHYNYVFPATRDNPLGTQTLKLDYNISSDEPSLRDVYLVQGREDRLYSHGRLQQLQLAADEPHHPAERPRAYAALPAHLQPAADQRGNFRLHALPGARRRPGRRTAAATRGHGRLQAGPVRSLGQPAEPASRGHLRRRSERRRPRRGAAACRRPPSRASPPSSTTSLTVRRPHLSRPGSISTRAGATASTRRTSTACSISPATRAIRWIPDMPTPMPRWACSHPTRKPASASGTTLRSRNVEWFVQDTWKLDPPAHARLRRSLLPGLAAVRCRRPDLRLPSRTLRSRRSRCSCSGRRVVNNAARGAESASPGRSIRRR